MRFCLLSFCPKLYFRDGFEILCKYALIIGYLWYNFKYNCADIAAISARKIQNLHRESNSQGQKAPVMDESRDMFQIWDPSFVNIVKLSELVTSHYTLKGDLIRLCCAGTHPEWI